MGKERLRKVGRPLQAQSKIDRGKVLELRMRGLSHREIAEYFGVSKSAITYILAKLKPVLENVDLVHTYENAKPQLLSAMEFTLLSYLANPETLSKASANNLAYAFDRLFQANRLTRGQATANIDIAQVDQSLADIREEKRKLLEQLRKIAPALVVDGEIDPDYVSESI